MKKKATIFDETVLKEFLAKKMDNSYWEVRQAISTMAFLGACATLSARIYNWRRSSGAQMGTLSPT